MWITTIVRTGQYWWCTRRRGRDGFIRCGVRRLNDDIFFLYCTLLSYHCIHFRTAFWIRMMDDRWIHTLNEFVNEIRAGSGQSHEKILVDTTSRRSTRTTLILGFVRDCEYHCHGSTSSRHYRKDGDVDVE